MPCYTLQKVEIDSGKMHLGELMAALKAMGYNPFHPKANVVQWGNAYTYSSVTGVLSGPSEAHAMDVKRAYAQQVVKSQAARFGWSVKTQPDGKLLVMKGKF